jgi:hypothetical protein
MGAKGIWRTPLLVDRLAAIDPPADPCLLSANVTQDRAGK